MCVADATGLKENDYKRSVSEAGAALNKTLALPSIEAIKRCAAAGMGVAVLPRIAVEKELAQHQLVPLSWPKDTIRVYLQMIRQSEKWQSSAHVAFWQLAKHLLAFPVRNPGRPK